SSAWRSSECRGHQIGAGDRDRDGKLVVVLVALERLGEYVSRDDGEVGAWRHGGQREHLFGDRVVVAHRQRGAVYHAAEIVAAKRRGGRQRHRVGPRGRRGAGALVRHRPGDGNRAAGIGRWWPSECGGLQVRRRDGDRDGKLVVVFVALEHLAECI